ncbi:Core-2/I-Branching enzyme, partial [Musa troglodytarum]
VLNEAVTCYALIVLADSLYYTKFKLYCKPAFDNRNCYADEHYLPTLLSTGHFYILQMVDPTGIANWSMTHVDWSEEKWHPKAYRAQDITFELLKNITSIVENYHVTNDENVNLLELVFIYADSFLVMVQLFLICFLYSCHNHRKHLRLDKSNLNLCKLTTKFYSFSFPLSYFGVFMRLESGDCETLCLWNGAKRPCYLFAGKFYPEALDNLMQLFSNYTLI